MKAEELTIPAVRAVVTAMCDGDREAFFAAFTPSEPSNFLLSPFSAIPVLGMAN
jgi:hypothetical protein